MMEEYLRDVDDHDQKMLQKHVMDLAADATFVYSTLQAAHYHHSHSSNKEKALSLQMMKYWANFARTGNPNGGKLPYWPRYNKDEKYLQLDLTTRVGVMLREEKMAFWKRLHQN